MRLGCHPSKLNTYELMSDIKARIMLLNFAKAAQELVNGTPVSGTGLNVVVAHAIMANVIDGIERKQSEAADSDSHYQTPDIVARRGDRDCRLAEWPVTHAWACELAAADREAHAAAYEPDSPNPIQWQWPKEMNARLLSHPEEATAIAGAFNPDKHRPKEKIQQCVDELAGFIELLQTYGFGVSPESDQAAEERAEIDWVALERNYYTMCHAFFAIIQNQDSCYKSCLFTHITPAWKGVSGYNRFLYITQTMATSIGVSQWVAMGGFQGCVVISPYGVDFSRAAVVQVVSAIHSMTGNGWVEFQRYAKMAASSMQGLRSLVGQQS